MSTIHRSLISKQARLLAKHCILSLLFREPPCFLPTFIFYLICLVLNEVDIFGHLLVHLCQLVVPTAIIDEGLDLKDLIEDFPVKVQIEVVKFQVYDTLRNGIINWIFV